MPFSRFNQSDEIGGNTKTIFQSRYSLSIYNVIPIYYINNGNRNDNERMGSLAKKW
jgi:hypothetical protein